MTTKSHKIHVTINVIAVFLIVTVIALCLTGIISHCNNYTEIASVLATLVGGVLVFSTLEMQRQSLNEEKNKNKISRFDSRFYPILSSFRSDATGVEIIRNYIAPKGKEIGMERKMSFNGDKAFYIANQIVETLQKSISEETFTDYDREEISIELSEIDKKEEALEVRWASEEELDKIIQERHDFLRSQQSPFLLHIYGITKEVKERLSCLDCDGIASFLLGKLLEKQPPTFTKYIRTLRFLIHIVERLTVSERSEYYLNVYSLLGKNEMKFLKNFKEFDCITKIENLL